MRWSQFFNAYQGREFKLLVPPLLNVCFVKSEFVELDQKYVAKKEEILIYFTTQQHKIVIIPGKSLLLLVVTDSSVIAKSL